jgi:pimeloyl-ACP methyl ester carboxylesterase
MDMRFQRHGLLLGVGCLSLFLLAGGTGRCAADEKDDVVFERKDFTTYDKVTLVATFYPSRPEAGKRDKSAVVLLVHDFSHAKGGGRNQGGWGSLAGKLQKEGYAVLSFDFRGFGDSKAVDSKSFFSFPQNRMLGTGRGRSGIDQKEFPRAYYKMLINDIAAARAFLSAMNDARDVNVNASNVIVVGAGQGATLAALWMAAECRRQKVESVNTNPGAIIRTQKLVVSGSPESACLRAAVWLTISPEVEGIAVGGTLKKALVDAAQTAHIPTLFLYGKTDEKAANLASTYLSAIQTVGYKKSENKTVKEQAVPRTGLAGAQLLGENLKTTDFLITFINRAMDDRGTRVQKDRDEEKSMYYWLLPWPNARNTQPILAKNAGESVPHFIPPEVIGMK